MSDDKDDVHGPIRRIKIVGTLIVGLFVGGFAVWATTAEITGAVITPGEFVVETNVKRVQHPTGGVVGEVLVKEGDYIDENQLVLRLDETVLRANLSLVEGQIDQLTARIARLRADRDVSAQIDFPADFIARRGEARVSDAINGEIGLFEARRASLEKQKSQLRERISQFGEVVTGLEAQRSAKDQELTLIRDELIGLETLFAKGLVPMARLSALKRDAARIEGERGQLIAEMGRVKGQIIETDLRLSQADDDVRTEAVTDLREGEAKLAELIERKVAAVDQLSRVDIRAPQAGYVHGLAVRVKGEVIEPGGVLMTIVPSSDVLVIDAAIPPQDRDLVAVGGEATVRVLAGEHRTLPDLKATVSRIGADLTRDERTHASYYEVRLVLDAGEMERLDGLSLRAGMPAEGFIAIGPRTPLSYLMKPVMDQIRHTWRER